MRHNLGAYGNLTRNIQLPPAGEAASRVVSNLLSYFIHEPSLCLWLRRQQQPLSTPFVWVLEEDAPLLGSLRVPLPRPVGTLRTTFCDEELRVSRGGRGGVFVLRRLRDRP